MKKKMFTCLAFMAGFVGLLTAQTGERFIMEEGKQYVFRVVGDEEKVIAYYEGSGSFIVEPYQAGNENQLFQQYAYSGAEEDYQNFSVVANDYCWDDHGRPIKPGTHNLDTWIAYDLELNEDGNIRFCHFLERWGWVATWEPQYKGVFLFLSGSDIAAMEYTRCLVSGERDYTEYESLEGELFDFKVEEIIGTSVKDKFVSDIKVTGAEGAIYIENANNTTVEIYSVAGQLLKAIQPDNSTTKVDIALPGIYLVKIGSEAFKIAVK